MITPFKDHYNIYIIDITGKWLFTTANRILLEKDIRERLGTQSYNIGVQKVRKVLETGKTERFEYNAYGKPHIAFINKRTETEVILHEARLINKDAKRTEEMLLVSSGYLYDKHYKKKIS